MSNVTHVMKIELRWRKKERKKTKVLLTDLYATANHSSNKSEANEKQKNNVCVFQFNVDSIAVCMFRLSSERAEIQLKCTSQFPVHGVSFVYFKVAA